MLIAFCWELSNSSLVRSTSHHHTYKINYYHYTYLDLQVTSYFLLKAKRRILEQEYGAVILLARDRDVVFSIFRLKSPIMLIGL
ncbi:hypothetical protein midi_00079 [Candidatus Midichloria mitochondrii IricVA]|uniref:Uncharacterized protein n=1 Tax=Midichloria mitochondrii (strain IricVA) TaxID=696127 RepID=F7XUQ5_MIDMI|nr:hypothetical protein midi_00079 [Candidatus Midichloria mitochondrii IricVA]